MPRKETLIKALYSSLLMFIFLIFVTSNNPVISTRYFFLFTAATALLFSFIIFGFLLVQYVKLYLATRKITSLILLIVLSVLLVFLVKYIPSSNLIPLEEFLGSQELQKKSATIIIAFTGALTVLAFFIYNLLDKLEINLSLYIMIFLVVISLFTNVLGNTNISDIMGDILSGLFF